MRFDLKSMVMACCVLVGATETSMAADGDAQCSDKPNLAIASATLSGTSYMAGTEPAKVTDDVMMMDFTVSVANSGGIDSEGAGMSYSAAVQSTAGADIESFDGVTSVYWLAAGAAEDTLVSIMASKLTDLVQPSGEIAGKVVFKAMVDVDNRINECDESDNAFEGVSELHTEKVVG